ncbi:MAG: hypothetical protein JO171_12130 [Paludibacterium sp.]|uniref:hypothetical protein n=1 Tax=Paludibacterium sp. TaxID=1917523 RepID=UPI0025F1A8EC|nr:hypothetical protein [Paludibacterium sp.]MBV8047899.1 hypothetical protein [Paludibacterium sp.]MBV8647469.1 hypothetical protein [Paludibacterium sp.]
MSAGIRSDASGVMGALQVAGADAMQFTNAGSAGSIAPFTASVAANALTGVLSPYSKVYRSLTQSGGVPTQVTNTANLSLTVPNGATLGSASGIPSTLVWLSLWNGSSESLGVVNITNGSINLDESLLVSTTAISSSATSAGVVYSAVALTNVAFKIVGYTTITEATAGAWATAPAVGAGVGGFAGENLIGLGVGQTWQNVTASRAAGTTYYNTTGRPIVVSLMAGSTGFNTAAYLYVNGGAVSMFPYQASYGPSGSAFAVVPPGASYMVSSNVGSCIQYWMELR